LSTPRTSRLTAIPAADAPSGTALSHDQRQALLTILGLLDQPGPRCAIGLFGPAGSGKTVLLDALRSGALRTPQDRRVICAALDAARLSAGPAPWQQLLLRVLDSLAALAGAPAVIYQLRAELNALAWHEASNNETATLAAAAFAHRFRSSFAGIVQNAVLSAGATFVVAIDHLDAAPASDAAQLLEASQYFLNGQGCGVLICADEARLTKTLNDASALARWLTARVALAQRTQPTAAAQASATHDATALPLACARLFGDVLGSDYYAIERASAQWRTAAQALSHHQAGGHVIPITAESLAKLCALKVISPMLFDATCLDPALLLHLERQAQARGSASLALSGWSEVLARDPRLMRLFAGPPRLTGTHPSYLLAALRLIQTGSPEMLQALPASGDPIQEAHVAQSASHSRRPAINDALSASLIAALIGFGADRLAKQVALAQPLGEADLLRTGLGVGAELAGLALCVLLLPFALKPADRLRGWALGLLTGGLASLLLDRLTLGAPANHLQVAPLPLFSLAHAALLAGALALIAALASSRAH